LVSATGEKALQAAPGAGQVRGQSHSFFYRSNTLNQGTADFPPVVAAKASNRLAKTD